MWHCVWHCDTDKKDLPKAIVKQRNELSRDHSKIVLSGTTDIIVRQGKKQISFITTIYFASRPEHVQRYDATDHRKIPVPYPGAVKFYNVNMRGTDKNSQMTRMQKCRGCNKW